MPSHSEQIALSLKVKVHQVDAAIKLLDEGATVPFIARYRKEMTDYLTDTHLRALETDLIYLRELDKRREVILESILKQDKLTPALKKAIDDSETKTALEDLYLPFKPKRRTRAQIALEAGLGPLAEALIKNPEQPPEEVAQPYISEEKGISSAEKAIDGARDILIEQFSENANLLHELRETIWENATLSSSLLKNMSDKGKKFVDYFDFKERMKSIPSHRALALFRGRRENVLSLSVQVPNEEACIKIIAKHANLPFNPEAKTFIAKTLNRAYKVKLHPKLELELINRLRERAEDEAIDVFATNLKDLLLLPPAGNRITMGLDPAIRSGIKVVVIDETGKLLDYTTLYPFAPQNLWQEALSELAKLTTKYQVELIGIGNGTGSRETDRLCTEMFKVYKDLNIKKTIINEAGASVYSASELASNEFPDLDVSLRGAVSIARRLQDPLAELVKIEPKAIGVGQYQHDVNQIKLARKLDTIVEDCVNTVGVDVNIASPTLLKYVAGFNETLAKNLTLLREKNGPFQSREALKAIERMGDKTFEQAAGFLRIRNAENPLDNSAVHPEAYPLVENIVASLKTDINQLIANTKTLRAINAETYATPEQGVTTVKDILKELEKPGRDPRASFKTATFKEGVETINDLEIDMMLEGIVSNVTKFGAFINIGVHQDGLVHISEMTTGFISDPRKVAKAGDIVTVKVIELDLKRKRINLSMKLSKPELKPKPKRKPIPKMKTVPIKKPARKIVQKPAINSAMADALSKLKSE
jgi:uncharacterized protein